jgi:RNA-directed DNA polymerase
MGVERLLDELRQELRSGSYRRLPARERLIPKRSGKLRSLGIAALRDRFQATDLRDSVPGGPCAATHEG